MKKVLLILLPVVLVGTVITFYFYNKKSPISLVSQVIAPTKELPLLQYAIPKLHQENYMGSQIIIDKLIKVEPEYSSYLFSYQTLHKKMTGLVNIPTASQSSTKNNFPVLIMVRGFIPPAQYQPGSGTKNAAEYFAQHGYVTIAPDFLGFGESDKESSDIWEARFQKPLNVVELLKTVQGQTTITIPAEIVATHPTLATEVTLNTLEIGMWAHSNGGQIALTSLEILNQPIPTTLWAPVTAPFPYSVLFFSDEENDEGKASRKWIADFDKHYDAFDFSFTQHLELLTGPIQLHQGMLDEAIHYVWSDEFVDKIKQENSKRKTTATASATITAPIEITYYKYPNTNHNMQPDWQVIIARDLEFFDKNMKSNSTKTQ